MLTILATLLLAAGLVPLLQRDLRRAVHRRQWRRNVQRLGIAAQGMSVAMSGFVAAAVRAAAEMERTAAQIAAVFAKEGE
jgi:hypothetical protein